MSHLRNCTQKNNYHYFRGEKFISGCVRVGSEGMESKKLVNYN